ncbi:MAG TPA: acyltransferase family protein [Acidimicrobiales bacterium]|nr:acyltransferase family protein [Acidimicrobiales bacterium]
MPAADALSTPARDLAPLLGETGIVSRWGLGEVSTLGSDLLDGASDGVDRHVAHIDGLRAVAVVAVLAYHLHAGWLPGGFGGVDVFFVISGFVVTGALARRRAEARGLRSNLIDFYSRRLRRIAPALIVCLLVTGLATAFLITHSWLSETNLRTGEGAFFGISNFRLIQNNGAYFSPRTEFNPYTHTWSLGVEEQFYLVFPLLLFACTSARVRAWISVALLGIAAAASLVFAAVLAHTHPTVAFYALPSRFWELGAGAVLYQVFALCHGEGRARLKAFSPARAAAGAGASAMLLAAGLLFARPEHTPFPDALVPVIGTIGILVFTRDARGGGVVRRVLESRFAVGIGRISYSLYLWHWPIFVLLRLTTGLESFPTQFAAAVLTTVAALLSYRLVERPCRYAPVMVRMPRFAVIAAGVLVIAMAARLHGAIDFQQTRLSLSTVSQHAEDWYPSAPMRGAELSTCAAGEGPRLRAGQFATRYAHSCADSGARGRIFAIGDSHALMFERMLRQVAMETGRDLYLSSTPACPVGSLRPGSYALFPKCRAFETAVVDEVSRLAQPGDVLFLASLRLSRLSTDTEGSTPTAVLRKVAAEVAADRLTEVDAATALLAPLARRGIRVVFEAPTPLFTSPAFRCADWFNHGNPVCRGLAMDRALLDRYRAPVLAAFSRIGGALPGVSVWDPFPVLCPDRVCYAMRGDKPLFFDGDHVSGYANRILAPSLSRLIA